MADDDEDWFEAAFEDEASEADSDDADGAAVERDDEPEAVEATPDDDAPADTTSDDDTPEEDVSAGTVPADGPTPDDDAPDAADTDADDFAAAFGAGSGAAEGDDRRERDDQTEVDAPTQGNPDGSDDQGDDSPDDFAAAFQGDSGGASDDGDDGDLFDDDFADAFAGASGGGGAQMPGGGGGGGDQNFGFDLDGDTGAGDPGGDFEEEDFESDIPRIDVGIEGLDDMIQGGVPERSLMVAVGEAGTGKTTFGLQFLHEAIENGERAVFITLEESRERVVQSADEKGWNFSEHTANGDLAVVDIDPIEMANSLTSIRNELPRLVEEFGASRLVLDSVSLLEMMYDDQSTRRTEIYDFTKALKEAGVTTMLTSEASEDNSFASRYGVIEYLTDAVVVLRYIRPEDFRETRLAVEIQKIRDANHSRETKPYEITHQGISVYRQANIF
ncbi:KaiC domain protein, AF_0351 family [Halobacterium jilantaiense]|uniref:KaiC domain protein, AF_0351 family n=1 Tax=Halobacterium jilantaiense TaxID=355548 RepID=A0A1I0Q9Y5_9EURY|nr:KaiC domain-containing protein [Halobacterium jilantaiense]SEW23626.1 KaiC domain protein, AF_0351 family [Halobacterium jilantaiense]